ncbi:MAG: hypothetical protein ABIY90_01935 [Puia sp.]
MKKKYFLVVGISLLLLTGWAFYLYHKPHRNTAGQDTDFQIPAAELYAAFQRDEASANRKFMGRVIEVSGTVSDIETGTGSTNVLISASGQGGISCSFSTGGMPSPGSIKKGSSLIIKGRCTGFLMDVNLVDCVLKE